MQSTQLLSSMCVRCARRMLQTSKTNLSRPPSRQYANKLRRGGPQAPPSKATRKTSDTLRLAAEKQKPAPPARELPIQPPKHNLKDQTLADTPWATTFTNAIWIASGTAFFGLLGYYGATYYTASTRPVGEGGEQRPIDLTAVYDEYAPHFDADVDRTEYWNGIMTLRSRLVKQAKGDVLESAAGTGRNAEYYVKERIKSLTVVDKSKGMLGVAEKKWPEDRKDEDWSGRVRFMVGDVEDAEMRAQLGQQYDTVVQTLGLCSTDDPDGLMRSLTQLVKPGGRILLLEHGQSYFEALNMMLDRSAHEHATKHGCWWNRDIGAVVEKSGMEIVKITRTWRSAGTNWYIILRKPVQNDTQAQKKQ